MSFVPQLLVVADDLTGANDTGAQFAKQGVPSFVFLNEEFSRFPQGAQVVVVNTESRHAEPKEAARRVGLVTLRGANLGVKSFFKKTDSTLRGNLGSELAAFHAAVRSPILPFVPAFPELGRTTRGGIHFVFGRPIAETSFSADPLNPIRESDLRKIIGKQTTIQVRSFTVKETSRFDNFSGILACDCEDNEELKFLGDKLFGQAKLRVGAGSAAFAQEMARFIGFEPALCAFDPPQLPLLLVNGSVNESSLSQIRHPCTSVFSRHRISPAQLQIGSGGKRFVEEIQREIRKGKTRFLLHSIVEREELKEFKENSWPVGESVHLKVASATGEIVRDLLDQNFFRTLVVFGGDTLSAIARACQWHGFVPESELCAGVTVAHPTNSNLQVISKAGGFGEPGLIDKILRSLRQ